MACKSSDEITNFQKDVDDKLPTVIVTGFGPFRAHKINSSWVTVQELSKLGIDGVNLIVQEIPVVYESVEEKIPKLWQKYNPKLVVHCGMAPMVDRLILEQVAKNNGYEVNDVQGKLPKDQCCIKSGTNLLCSKLNMSQVCQKINSSGSEVPAVVSKDAGSYLCEFIYYTSLHINSATAFIHVPPIDQPYNASQLAESLRIAICAMLEQLNGSITS